MQHLTKQAYACNSRLFINPFPRAELTEANFQKADLLLHSPPSISELCTIEYPDALCAQLFLHCSPSRHSGEDMHRRRADGLECVELC
jgi:hypothetical protein